MGLTIETKPISARQSHPTTGPDCHVERYSIPCSEPILTVIIPVYNEVRTVDELFRRVLASSYSKQVIVVDDGSVDGTMDALEKWRKNPLMKLLRHPINRGKGAAIRTGLAHASGKFVIVQDADLEYDPADYPLLIEPLIAGKAQAVYGSRYLVRKPLTLRSVRWLWLGVSFLNFCVRLLYGVHLTDEATCYKAFSTDLLRKLDLKCERFEFCPEVTAKICRLGLKIDEVPIRYESRNIQAGKKLRWTDGIEALKTLWMYRHWNKETFPASTHSSKDFSRDPVGAGKKRKCPRNTLIGR